MRDDRGGFDALPELLLLPNLVDGENFRLAVAQDSYAGHT